MVRKFDRISIEFSIEFFGRKFYRIFLAGMPHVLPADAEKFSIYKEIEFKVSLPIAYRTRQCDTITVPQATTFAWRLGVKNAPEKPR